MTVAADDQALESVRKKENSRLSQIPTNMPFSSSPSQYYETFHPLASPKSKIEKGRYVDGHLMHLG